MISHPLFQRAASSTRTERPILVAVHNACEEIVAGLGSALFSVRTLDGLSCDVRAGELLLLVGGVASGATSLLGALYGPPASRARAQRYAIPGVQLRRATIGFGASEAIVAGWSDAQASTPIPHSSNAATAAARTPVVYLLRVRADDSTRAGCTGAITTHSWRSWAAALRERGGAIVLARANQSSAAPQENEKRTGDRAVPSEISMVRESADRGRHQMRTITLHAGRIISADWQ